MRKKQATFCPYLCIVINLKQYNYESFKIINWSSNAFGNACRV